MEYLCLAVIQRNDLVARDLMDIQFVFGVIVDLLPADRGEVGGEPVVVVLSP